MAGPVLGLVAAFLGLGPPPGQDGLGPGVVRRQRAGSELDHLGRSVPAGPPGQAPQGQLQVFAGPGLIGAVEQAALDEHITARQALDHPQESTPGVQDVARQVPGGQERRLGDGEGRSHAGARFEAPALLGRYGHRRRARLGQAVGHLAAAWFGAPRSHQDAQGNRGLGRPLGARMVQAQADGRRFAGEARFGPARHRPMDEHRRETGAAGADLGPQQPTSEGSQRVSWFPSGPPAHAQAAEDVASAHCRKDYYPS